MDERRSWIYHDHDHVYNMDFSVNYHYTGADAVQVAQAPKGAVNMTLRNSVIFIRVCMGIERS